MLISSIIPLTGISCIDEAIKLVEEIPEEARDEDCRSMILLQKGQLPLVLVCRLPRVKDLALRILAKYKGEEET